MLKNQKKLKNDIYEKHLPQRLNNAIKNIVMGYKTTIEIKTKKL